MSRPFLKFRSSVLHCATSAFLEIQSRGHPLPNSDRLPAICCVAFDETVSLSEGARCRKHVAKNRGPIDRAINTFDADGDTHPRPTGARIDRSKRSIRSATRNFLAAKTPYNRSLAWKQRCPSRDLGFEED